MRSDDFCLLNECWQTMKLRLLASSLTDYFYCLWSLRILVSVLLKRYKKNPCSHSITHIIIHTVWFIPSPLSLLHKKWEQSRSSFIIKGGNLHMKAGKHCCPCLKSQTPAIASGKYFWSTKKKKLGFFWAALTFRCLLLLQWFPSVLHQQADGCRSCVELGHFVLLNNLPEPADMRVNWNTFKLEKTHTHMHHKEEWQTLLWFVFLTLAASMLKCVF